MYMNRLHVHTIIYVATPENNSVIQLSAHNLSVGSNKTFNCSSGEVIPVANLCDGEPDCAAGEDESKIFIVGKTVELLIIGQNE